MGCAPKAGSTIASSGSTPTVRHCTGHLKTRRSPLLKWTSAHAQKELGAFIRVRERTGALYLRGVGEGVRHEAEHRFLDISKIYVGPVELKMLRFTPADLTSDQSSVSSPYVATGREHKFRNVTNAGTRLCSYVPETKNVVISEQYTLKTSNSREGILKMESEFPPPGIIGAGNSPTSTILLKVILGDPS